MFQVSMKSNTGWIPIQSYWKPEHAIRDARERKSIHGLQFAVFANMLGKSEQIFTTR